MCKIFVKACKNLGTAQKFISNVSNNFIRYVKLQNLLTPPVIENVNESLNEASW